MALGESASGTVVNGARVLSVIDSAAPQTAAAAEVIEIRVGPWLVSVSRPSE